MEQETSQPVGLRDIAKIDPAAAALVGDLMLASARERESIEAMLRESADAQIERWKQRALKAERRLELAQSRLLSLFDDVPGDTLLFDGLDVAPDYFQHG